MYFNVTHEILLRDQNTEVENLGLWGVGVWSKTKRVVLANGIWVEGIYLQNDAGRRENKKKRIIEVRRTIAEITTAVVDRVESSGFIGGVEKGRSMKLRTLLMNTSNRDDLGL